MGAGQPVAGGQQGGQHKIRHRPRHRRHGGDEDGRKGSRHRHHAPRDSALRGGAMGAAQPGQFGGKLRQQRGKGGAGPGMGLCHGGGGAFCRHDQVDGAMDQPQPPVLRQMRRGGFGPAHQASSPLRDTGHGAPFLRVSDRRPDRR